MREIELNGRKMREMPRPVYNQCIWIVRDYKRLIKLIDKIDSEIGEANQDYSFYADQREGLIRKAVVDNARFMTKCVDEAILVVPDDLRQGIYENISDGKNFDENMATINTWKKWKGRYVHDLAKKLNLY